MTRLCFPYGIANFRAIHDDGALYIDRTDRIATMERIGRQLLLLRPRRFGKSLWLSTLEHYYDLARADEFETLFGHLAIGRAPTVRRNRYFIMKWNFSTVDPMGDAEAIRGALYRHINGRIATLVSRYADRLPQPVEIQGDALASFQSLLAAVGKSPHPLYLLIDEYDNFANEVLVSRDRGEERYNALVGGEGAIKTVFKAVKDAAEGGALDRVFITGVSPVVLADITSGYNVAKDITLEPELADLCGFHESEIAVVLDQIIAECGLPAAQAKEALDLMRAFYNGYNFSLTPEGGQIYNPTLALYFFEHLAGSCRYPEEMLDNNLAMDRNRIDYIAQLPHGQSVVTAALDRGDPLRVEKLERRFGVERMLRAPQTERFLASLLYFFGVLTYGGHGRLRQLQLVIPNLVVRKLYVERIQESLLPGFHLDRERRAVCNGLYAEGEIGPVCEFIEQRFLPVFDNRDLRWSNELVVKTAFLVTLFDDLGYIMDSETAIGRGYCDLSMIVRPDARPYGFLDHLIEFKHLKLADLPGLDSETLAKLPIEQLRARPEIASRLAEANAQLAVYRERLQAIYGAALKLQTHAVVCIGLLRFVWASVPGRATAS
ncbi:AAA family ATPase [Halochromatium roseum]|uniref:AAA family ATPase n=1 Tax=Halochromatium roseum TaxID=391920 RepID=UPI0019139C8B|nr:AAA family ATPase [Halochromatium roseum]MBK5938588.1 AAA family ATPase [Halochromatium roseum]